MANVATMALVSKYTTLWQQCWKPQICAHIPFDGDKCLSANICVAIIEDNGTFYIEGSINGATAKYALADACIPVYNVGVASLKICVTNLNIANGILRSLTLSVEVCIGGSIGPINLSHCWDLFNQTINFHSFTSDEIIEIIGLDVSAQDRQGEGWKDQKMITSSVITLNSVDGNCNCS